MQDAGFEAEKNNGSMPSREKQGFKTRVPCRAEKNKGSNMQGGMVITTIVVIIVIIVAIVQLVIIIVLLALRTHRPSFAALKRLC